MARLPEETAKRLRDTADAVEDAVERQTERDTPDMLSEATAAAKLHDGVF